MAGLDSFDWADFDNFNVIHAPARLSRDLYCKGKSGGNKPMERNFRKMRVRRLIAYDLETTNIAEGTPDVLYVTAFCGDEKKPYRLSKALPGPDHQLSFLHVLETDMLIAENDKCRFVAWNGNKYDALLAAIALLRSNRWIIRPYLTRSNTVRGMKIIGVGDCVGLEFELLDGMAMTGLDTVGMPLKKFLSMFAPEYSKLDLDFSKESFNPNNPDHVAYAERDSEGLWYAMRACNARMVELTGNELQPTMGRAAIHYFMSKIPEGVKVWRPNEELFDVIHTSAKRGGYVWIDRQYRGPVWKYDLNQAYAGAMRDCSLPCGSPSKAIEYVDGLPGIYRCEISRRERSPIPFYFKGLDGAAGFTSGGFAETWILSTEIAHLLADDWRVEVVEGWVWPESFNMKDMVDELERARFTDPEGPGGPFGTLIKVTGNSSYGKTLEKLDGVSLAMAQECPEGMSRYLADADTPIFCERGEPHKAPYHQPQLGAFITAHVRLQVREAALQSPETFLYADTDCVVFSAPARGLDIDPRRYGAWKVECEGVEYTLIGKKVYCGADGTKHAKGMRVRELAPDDFERWKKGVLPKQHQLQRVNFVKLAQGVPMFRYLDRIGTDVKKLKTVNFDGNKFTPLK